MPTSKKTNTKITQPLEWLVVRREKGAKVVSIIDKYATENLAKNALATKMEALYATGNALEANMLEAGHLSKYTEGPAPTYDGKRGRVRHPEGKMLSEFTNMLPSTKAALGALLNSLKQSGARDENGHQWSKSAVLGVFAKHCLSLSPEEVLNILRVTSPTE